MCVERIAFGIPQPLLAFCKPVRTPTALASVLRPELHFLLLIVSTKPATRHVWPHRTFKKTTSLSE